MSASVINSPSASSGLFSAATHAPVPLERVRVDVHVVEAVARVVVRQSYRNLENVPLEAVYTFPLDEGSAVCGFEAVVDGVRYVGRVMGRDEAFRTYDDALEAGHGGYLLDEERADLFTASLGNLKPGGAVELSITYVTELAAEGEGVRFTLPTTVSPRYAPAQDQTGVGPTPAEALNPPVAFEVPYGFSVEMDVTMSGAIRSVQSPSHPVECELHGAGAKVRLAQREAPMDRDLVIVIGADNLSVPHAVVERGASGAAVAVSFLPAIGPGTQPAEVIFVIDRSGSMAGPSIAEVRNALQLCLRSLASGSRFNIVSFGSRYEPLFDRSRAYDEASLEQAAAFVRSLEADMGGTEILPALQYVVQQPPVAGMARQVLVLTDGQVTNTDAVIDLARRHAATARFFTFGIGAGASHHLVKGLARASRGAAEFIAPGERIEAKVMRQFRRVFAPAMTDVRVDWGQAGLTPASDRVPPVFDGERVRVYALGETIAAGAATLHATVAGRAVAFEIRIAPAAAIEGDIIATLAARERIRALEEEGEYLEHRGSLQRRGRTNSKAAAEIAALGVKYQLASRETSFVAVEHRDPPCEGRAELRRVPVALTSGWGGLHDARVSYVCAPQVASFGATPMADPSSSRLHGWVQSAALDTSPDVSLGDLEATSAPGMMSGPLFDRLAVRRRAPRPTEAQRQAQALRPLDVLVGLQGADGSWALDDAFGKAVSLKLRALERMLRNAAGNADAVRRALATAVALVWLEKHAAAERGEWDLLARKATAWLSTSGTEPAAGQGWNAWLDLARRMI
jgi:Ca-activated chloride channel family protein